MSLKLGYTARLSHTISKLLFIEEEEKRKEREKGEALPTQFVRELLRKFNTKQLSG